MNKLENIDRIRRSSRRLRVLLAVVFWALPLVNAVFWLSLNRLPAELQMEVLPAYVRFPLPAQALVLGFLVSMLPFGVVMLGLASVRQLCALYCQGQIFMPANVLWYQRLSRALIWLFACGIVANSLLSIVLTLHFPPGQRIFTVSLTSSDLSLLLVGWVLTVITSVMEEGRKLQEEQDLTI